MALVAAMRGDFEQPQALQDKTVRQDRSSWWPPGWSNRRRGIGKAFEGALNAFVPEQTPEQIVSVYRKGPVLHYVDDTSRHWVGHQAAWSPYRGLEVGSRSIK